MRAFILFTLLLAVAHPNPSVSEPGGRKANVICDIFCEAAKRPPPPYQYRHLIEPAVPSPSAIKPQSSTAATGNTVGLSLSTGSRRLSLTYSQAQLQHSFKHAKDFGVSGSWNKRNGELFQNAIENHVRNPNTVRISGSYRGSPATHFYNPTNGNNVFTKADGNFWGGWKLSQEQARNITSHGGLK